MPYGFELIKKKRISEIDTIACLYVHTKTGAQLLSLSNKDENKVFGITFRTPPWDSTGLPHILEHSVLCGSRKYPLKEPFVELLKGSMSTFLNAFTYPDKTCYPVASQNVKDFYNLIDVYLDAVFYPRLTKHTFQQEGWHYSLKSIDSPLAIKGIVYSEMKGAYSSPDTMLEEYSLRSLFPDTVYRYDAGGDPKEIPGLTYERFIQFHKSFYNPSNAFIWFYGNDDPDKRLAFIGEYLKDFKRKRIESEIPTQPVIYKPRHLTKRFMVDKGQDLKGMITMNWLLPDRTDQKLRISFMILEHILVGMPGSPLRKALIESGLGEDMAGVGLEKDIRYLFFSTGLKGVDKGDMKKVEALILDTLNMLAKDGIDGETVEAALNTIEFRLRENNTGRFPRGLSLMLRALTFWIYGGDPISAICFESQIDAIKENLKREDNYFESMIRTYFLDNLHRTVLIFQPDPDMKEREEREERERLERIKSGMSISELEKIMRDEEELRKMQQRPDPPEALARIPLLSLKDVDKKEKKIPIEIIKKKGTEILFHDIFSNGIFYIDLGFDLHSLDKDLLRFTPLIGRALVEMGTKKSDFVRLGQRIGRITGGIRPNVFIHQIRNEEKSVAKLFLRAKSLSSKVPEMLEILKEIILFPQFQNRDRFLQILLEETARYEKNLIPLGHEILRTRLYSHFSESGLVNEKITGIDYLLFLKGLVGLVKKDWDMVLDKIQQAYRGMLNKNGLILNITASQDDMKQYEDRIDELLYAIPENNRVEKIWQTDEIPEFEAISITSRVNFVGKGACLYKLGYRFHGSIMVITRYLRNTWLWEKVRVQGGAYGAFCMFDRLSGALCFVSYRDPNILETVDVFDGSADFLRKMDLDKRELQKGILRTLADIDAPLLPDAKGFRSMEYYLTRDTDEARQEMREQILRTVPRNFKEFAEILHAVKDEGIIKIMAPLDRLKSVSKNLTNKLHILRV